MASLIPLDYFMRSTNKSSRAFEADERAPAITGEKQKTARRTKKQPEEPVRRKISPQNSLQATLALDAILAMLDEPVATIYPEPEHGEAIADAIRAIEATPAVLGCELIPKLLSRAATNANRFGAEPLLALQEMGLSLTQKVPIKGRSKPRAIDLALVGTAYVNDARSMEKLIAAGANPRVIISGYSVAEVAVSGYLDAYFLYDTPEPRALAVLQKSGVDLNAKNAKGKDLIDAMIRDCAHPGLNLRPRTEYLEREDIRQGLASVGIDVTRLEQHAADQLRPKPTTAPAPAAPAPAPQVDGSSIDAAGVSKIRGKRGGRGAA